MHFIKKNQSISILHVNHIINYAKLVHAMSKISDVPRLKFLKLLHYLHSYLVSTHAQIVVKLKKLESRYS